MTTIFKEFSATFERFVEEFPDHPLTEEIRDGIVNRRFPPDEWMVIQTKRMNDLLRPLWLQAG